MNSLEYFVKQTAAPFFYIFFLLSTFRILFRGIRDGSLSVFLLRFMVSFKSSPFSKLIELSRLYSEHAVQILTSIAAQFLDPVIKDSEGFWVPLRILKVIPQYCIAHLYCARFPRHQRAHMSACSCKTWRICLDIELCQLKNGYSAPTSMGTPTFFSSHCNQLIINFV